MSTVLQTLKDARALIEDPKHWTRFAPARDANGKEVFASGQDAVCWCALGAIAKATAWCALIEPAAAELEETIAANGDLRPAGRLSTLSPLATLNDYGTHAGVLRAFDLTIRRLEQ